MGKTGFLATITDIIKRRGIFFLARKLAVIVFTYPYYRVFKSSRQFTFQSKKYSYLYDIYNTTWRNERAVEVPIVWEFVKQNMGKRILEVGNVLSHYFYVEHDVLDKYENLDGVIKEDIVDFNPKNKYDLAVSISTLEHVGWDEIPRTPEKILDAIKNLRNIIKKNGRIIMTIPMGFNSYLDKSLNDGKIHFSKKYCLKRVSSDNLWIETNWDDIKHAKYGHPYPFANAVVVGIIEK